MTGPADGFLSVEIDPISDIYPSGKPAICMA